MKKALTMGELLVTMSIIGVIAVLVIPGFVQNYEQRVYLTKLKKSIEMIENAVNEACIDNNVSYFYQTSFANTSSVTNQQNFLNQYFKVADSNNVKKAFAKEYKIMGTAETKTISTTGAAIAKLATGEALALCCQNTADGHVCYFIIDTTARSNPNTGGRDLFTIGLDIKTNRLYDLKGKNFCGKDQYGRGCYARILQDNWEMAY